MRTAAYLVFLTVVVAVSLEVAVRMFLPQTLVHDPPGLWVPDSAVGWRRVGDANLSINSGERDVRFCTDSRGDRIPCGHERAAETCTQRVLVLGDSFVEALSIPWEQSVWAALEADTAACFEVAGVGGWDPGQLLAMARERLASATKYDLVLWHFYVGNDFVLDATAIPPAERVARREFHWFPPEWNTKGLKAWFYPANQWLESRSHAYVAVRFAIRRVANPGGTGFYGVPDVLVRSRLSNERISEATRGARLAAELAGDYGVPLVLVLIPHRSQILDPDGSKLEAAIPGLAGDVDMNQIQRRFVPRLAALSGVTVVDLLPPLRAHATAETWGTFDYHFSPDGHRLWAEALRDVVRDALGARPVDGRPPSRSSSR